jgi:chemotaxis protein CheD
MHSTGNPIKDILNIPAMPKITVHPGEQYVTDKPELITTLLGSCVAVCLFDPVAKVAGMNHFLLANRRYSREMPVAISEAGRYGINAMELLINALLHIGARKDRLRAKAFGGGNVLNSVSCDNFTCVGDINERFIREFLKTENIMLESEDLGGERGRVIKFRTDTYAVYRRFIVKNATVALEKKERGYWKKTIELHQKADETKSDVILFK